MNINYTSQAAADLDSIFEYISEYDQEAAKRVIARILQAIAMLERFPFLGRNGRIFNTRELSIARLPYYAVYQIASETEIDVITIMHERQQFP